MWRLVGMSTQDYARKQALELADTDPSAAFDLVLAADDLDRTAASHPDIVALNRSLRGIKTTAVKYLTKAVPDLIWSPSSNFDYIGLGTTVSYMGSVEAGGRWVIDIEVNYIKPNAQYDQPGEYGIRVVVKGKGNRQVHAEKPDSMTLPDLKSKPDQYLKKAAEAAKRNLSGSLDAEKAELLTAVEEALTAYQAEVSEVKALQKAIQGSKNLVSDATDIRRLIPSTKMDWPLTRIRSLLDEINKAGG